MNLSMRRREYESLPFRDDLVNEPVQGAYLRGRAHPGYVFQAQTYSRYDWVLWAWWCFKVDIEEDIED